MISIAATYGLTVMAPARGLILMFAVLSTANIKTISLCVLCACGEFIFSRKLPLNTIKYMIVFMNTCTKIKGDIEWILML